MRQIWSKIHIYKQKHAWIESDRHCPLILTHRFCRRAPIVSADKAPRQPDIRILIQTNSATGLHAGAKASFNF